jgi:hypothetical protein
VAALQARQETVSEGFVKGHGFSRDDYAHQVNWALALEVEVSIQFRWIFGFAGCP